MHAATCFRLAKEEEGCDVFATARASGSFKSVRKDVIGLILATGAARPRPSRPSRPAPLAPLAPRPSPIGPPPRGAAGPLRRHWACGIRLRGGGCSCWRRSAGGVAAAWALERRARPAQKLKSWIVVRCLIVNASHLRAVLKVTNGRMRSRTLRRYGQAQG